MPAHASRFLLRFRPSDPERRAHGPSAGACRSLRTALLLGLAVAGLAGCGHLDLVSEGDPNRVATGTVTFRDPALLPQEASLVVRVLDTSRHDLPPQVLASQTISNPGTSPVAYRIEYRAVDDQLRHGLNVDARVSYDGRVRLFNHQQVVITLRDADSPHEVSVEPVGP